MNIALVHFRVGELDGVSLEMDKWKAVLEKELGHKVIYLAGSTGLAEGIAIPEMSLDDSHGLLIRRNALSKIEDFDSPASLEREIVSHKDKIKQKILDFIDSNEIDFIIPNNLLSLPLNIPATIALVEAIKERNLRGLFHHHDFFWEGNRPSVYVPTCSFVQRCLDEYYPADLPGFKHVVINSIALEALKKRRGIDSTIVPNVFYFEEQDWVKDEYNSDLKNSLGITDSDIVINHATRIVNRKGIEMVIDLIDELNKPVNIKKLRDRPLYDGRTFGDDDKIILVLPNLVEDQDYKLKLESKMKRLGVEHRFCNDSFAHARFVKTDGSKGYSLWDSYVHSDLISYPSIQEGWGNQFLEGLKAKLPIVIFEYEVYRRDIGPLGFDTISLGFTIEKRDENNLAVLPGGVLEVAARKVITLLQDKDLRDSVVRKNYRIGKEKLSMTALAGYLTPLME